MTLGGMLMKANEKVRKGDHTRDKWNVSKSARRTRELRVPLEMTCHLENFVGEQG